LLSIDVIDCCNITLTASATDAICYGENGSIIFNANGGTLPLNYTINGASTTSPHSAPAGNYIISITDLYGCTASEVVTVGQAPELTINVSYSPILCYGGTTNVTVNAAGGSPAYSGIGVFATPAGNHNFVVTDNNGCNANYPITIIQPEPLQAFISSTPAQCGGVGGSLFASLVGGTGPYTYVWSTTQTGNPISDLSPGTYAVVITDANSCTVTNSGYVGTSGSLQVNLNVISPISCPGDTDGAIQASVINGVDPTNYSWNNGSTGTTLTNIGPGNYIVAVTDSWGCAGSAGISLNNPQSMIANAVINDVSCFGLNNGSISIIIEGGTSPYNFIWSNSETSQNIENLSAGTYSLSVIDAGSCSINTSFNVSQPQELYFNSIVNNISCFGYMDGGVILSASGGSAPYTFIVFGNDSEATGIVHTGLSEGQYLIRVIDNNSCTKEESILIAQPSELHASYSVTNLLVLVITMEKLKLMLPEELLLIYLFGMRISWISRLYHCCQNGHIMFR
jgi:hypothetical protein